MIKNIVFDIGNVLVDFRYNAYMEDLGFSQDVAGVIREKIIENDIWARLDLGLEPEEAIIQEMISRVAEYPEEAKLFFDKIIDIVEVYSYTESWIKEFKNRGYKVYLLSNYPKELYTLHEKEKYDFTRLVDGKVVSGFLGMSKPDPAIYNYLFEKYQLIPEECIFTDDRINNVETACSLGMHGIHFTDYETVANKMEEMLKG